MREKKNAAKSNSDIDCRIDITLSLPSPPQTVKTILTRGECRLTSTIVAETLISPLDSTFRFVHSKSKGAKNEKDRSIDHRALCHFDPSKCCLSRQKHESNERKAFCPWLSITNNERLKTEKERKRKRSKRRNSGKPRRQ